MAGARDWRGQRLTHAIMADRAVVAAAEIAMLRQKLAAAEARIREIEADKNNGFKPFRWWKSNKTKSTPTLDELRECMAALNCEIVKWWAYRVDGVYSEPFPSHDEARRAAERAAKEQVVPGDTTDISYEDKEGRWHDEVSKGSDRPETDVEG